MIEHSIRWIIAIHGDGKTAKISLPIATSPVFVGCLHLDDARAHAPSGVRIESVSAGPDAYVAPLIPREHTHRPMVDHHVDGAPHPTRIEGPPVTITVHDLGEAPALPTIKASVSGGVLALEFSEPIHDGAELGIVGSFLYALGGDS